MTSQQRGDSAVFPLAAPAPTASRARCYALVPCAGAGARAQAGVPKQYASLGGRALVLWTLEALARVGELDATLVVLARDDRRFAALGAEGDAEAAGACWTACVGGRTRADTVAAGLAELLARGARQDDWALVHDAARCLVRPDAVRRLIDECRADAVGGLLALPVADTLKRAGVEGAPRVAATVPRDAMWAAQTPQMFRIGPLREALRRGLARPDSAITDEAGAMEAMGWPPKLVRGDADNLKVTYPEDFALAERLLRTRDPALSKATP
ncbi:MAG: 2-C-methyl-D-erythritol 4-phosphate cytidylyltransferase [Burkholderiaceae bacterium]